MLSMYASLVLEFWRKRLRYLDLNNTSDSWFVVKTWNCQFFIQILIFYFSWKLLWRSSKDSPNIKIQDPDRLWIKVFGLSHTNCNAWMNESLNATSSESAQKKSQIWYLHCMKRPLLAWVVAHGFRSYFVYFLERIMEWNYISDILVSICNKRKT